MVLIAKKKGKTQTDKNTIQEIRVQVYNELNKYSVNCYNDYNGYVNSLKTSKMQLIEVIQRCDIQKRESNANTPLQY